MFANPRYHLCGVVDVNKAGAETLAETYNCEAFSTLSEAIERFTVSTGSPGGIEEGGVTAACDTSVSSVGDDDAPAIALHAIVISTPTFTHAKLIEEACRYGLAVFTEKPVDETAEKIVDLFEMCRAANVTLACGFQRRFDSSYVYVKNQIANDEIGKPLMANIFFADHPCPPVEFLLKGGNIFMDLLCHDADYIRWCLDGDDVASIYATGTSSIPVLEEAGVHDNATVVMKFKKGAVVTLSMSRSASYGYDQRCEIFGEKGLVKVANEHSCTGVLSNSAGIHQTTYKPGFASRFGEAFAAEMDAFADSILDGAEWPITAEDCIAAQKMADAAIVSCREGRAVEL